MYKINMVQPRCFVVTFDDLLRTKYKTDTNILLVECQNTIYVCDTYLDPDLIGEILEKTGLNGTKKRYCVILSHHHWDHVWGSSYFKNTPIISSYLCYEEMKKHYLQGRNEIACITGKMIDTVLPTLVITDKVTFMEDGVTIHCSPGHTADSVSVYFEREKIVFCGDNVEFPIPTYSQIKENGDDYIKTLENYTVTDAALFVPGHDRLLTKDDIFVNLRYIKDVLNGDCRKYNSDNYYRKHKTNLFK